MDLRERYHDQEEQFRAVLEAFQATIWTSIRVIVEDYDADKQTVSCQSASKSVVMDADGNATTVEIPIFKDIPVAHPSGGGVTLTIPIKKGDEGEVRFTCRSFDAWHQQGGVQPQVDAGMHSLANGTFYPGGRSEPRALKNVSKDSIQLRSDDADAKHMVDLHPDNGLTHKSWDHSITFAQDGLKTVATKLQHTVDQIVSNVTGSITHSAGSIIQNATGSIIKNAAKVLINCG